MSLKTAAVAILRRLGLHSAAVWSYVRLVNAVRWTLSRPAKLADEVRWVRGSPRRRRTARRYLNILNTPVELDLLVGTVLPDALAVVVCLWNRPSRIDDVLRMVDSQVLNRRLRLVLWNNQPADDAHYREAVARFRPAGALASVEMHTSPNIGGIGRFVAMRELVTRGYAGTFIMIDDDENVSASFVADLLDYAAPRTIAGAWAWLSEGRYWRRARVSESGHRANHIGTGGAACDSAIVRSEGFFRDIPSDYLFMEDMWMSRCALNSGWSLVAVGTPVEFVLSELDQGHAIFDQKEKFWKWMARPARTPAI